MKDLEFISGNFLDHEVPKNKRYLLKYFKTDLQLAFLRYYLVFGRHLNFVDHTGHYCSRRTLWILQSKYHCIVDTYEKAKKALTEEGMEMIHKIESGKFILTGKCFS